MLSISPPLTLSLFLCLSYLSLFPTKVTREIHGRTKSLTHRSQTPVEKANQNLKRGDTHAKSILPVKEPCILRQIGEYAKTECNNANGQPDDGEILEVPAVGVVAGNVQTC